MRRFQLFLALALIAVASAASAQPTFVNGLVVPGGMLDATRQPGANAGRLGFFSDLYYDPARGEWWAISDRGPGGGFLDYGTRVQRFTLDVNPWTGRISHFRVKETVKFTDPKGLLYPHNGVRHGSVALNGLNPLGLNADAGILGRSFDPEGLVIDPHTGHLIVADEYGPSVFEFDRRGRLVRVFETPANLIPKVISGAVSLVNYVADRDACSASSSDPTLHPPFCGLNGGRQDNRGFEGLAITPDGKKLYAVLQDPLVNEPNNPGSAGSNNGRNSRNVRIVVFDNDCDSPTYGTSIAQYAYQLEPQSDVLARINAQPPHSVPGPPVAANDVRQGRNIGLSAITAINDHEFLVLERDNRGIGVDEPAGANAVGTKRIYKIAIDPLIATEVSALNLPDDLAGAHITPVSKSLVFIDLAANTVLPNGKQAEKWEGVTIGPRLWNGGHLILTGNDNDYSVTQNASTNVQFDVYVDFSGHSVQRDLDQPTTLNGAEVGPVPSGFVLIPAVLHAYRASASDLAGYVRPGGRFRHDDWDDHDWDDDHGDHHDHRGER